MVPIYMDTHGFQIGVCVCVSVGAEGRVCSWDPPPKSPFPAGGPRAGLDTPLHVGKTDGPSLGIAPSGGDSRRVS